MYKKKQWYTIYFKPSNCAARYMSLSLRELLLRDVYVCVCNLERAAKFTANDRRGTWAHRTGTV